MIAPLPPPDAVPVYTQVPHPDGLDLGDVMAIFTDRSAPAPESLANCDADLSKVKDKTKSREEIDDASRELVRMDPVRYHWCFYSKLLQLEDQLKTATYLDERQEITLKAFGFLTPISRAFLAEYKDSRYLRAAAARYRKLSEFVFYRRLELSAQGAREMAGTLEPYGSYRKPVDPPRQGVLEKYGIVTVPAEPVIDPNQAPAPERTPASTPEGTPSPKPDVSPDPIASPQAGPALVKPAPENSDAKPAGESLPGIESDAGAPADGELDP